MGLGKLRRREKWCANEKNGEKCNAILLVFAVASGYKCASIHVGEKRDSFVMGWMVLIGVSEKD